MFEGDDPPPIPRETAETIVVNWGERLLGIARTATRDAVAAGNLADILQAPRGHLKNDAKRGTAIPLPHIVAHRNADRSVAVSIPEWEDQSTTQGLFDSTPDVFRRFDGKMVYADLLPSDPKTMKIESEAAAKAFFADYGEQLLPILQMSSETLKAASKAKDKEAFEAVFDSLFSFFGDSDAK